MDLGRSGWMERLGEECRSWAGIEFEAGLPEWRGVGWRMWVGVGFGAGWPGGPGLAPTGSDGEWSEGREWRAGADGGMVEEVAG